MCISSNGYNVLKSVDLTNFVKVMMCFLASCSNRRGQVSPVRTVALRRILLSFSSCVQFSIMRLIVCSSFSPQGHVELGIKIKGDIVRGATLFIITGGNIQFNDVTVV